MNATDYLSNARKAISNAPSFAKLRARAISHLKTLYSVEGVAREVAAKDAAPELYLRAHAGVWGAKSARARTLYRLAREVIAESGIQTAPPGKFRGEGERLLPPTL